MRRWLNIELVSKVKSNKVTIVSTDSSKTHDSSRITAWISWRIELRSMWVAVGEVLTVLLRHQTVQGSARGSCSWGPNGGGNEDDKEGPREGGDPPALHPFLDIR